MEQRRISSIAEIFLDFDTNPENNIRKIVRLAAHLIDAPYAFYQNQKEPEGIHTGVFPGEKHPGREAIAEVMSLLEAFDPDEVTHIHSLDIKKSNSVTAGLVHFQGMDLLGTRVSIDKEPIGVLALFLNRHTAVTDSILQLIRILSAAIAVEERRKRAVMALQESEEKYRVIFEGSPNGILVAEIQNFRLLYANEALARMFGYDPEHMLKKNVLDLHPASSLPEIKNGIAQTGSGEKSVVNDVPCLHQDGSTFYADIFASGISLGGQKLITAFFADVTQRKKDALALVNSNIELKKINSELDNFVYSVSHDLRSPLLAIQGLIRLIFAFPESIHPEITNYLNMIMASANRMDDTIKEILEYSRNARLDIKKSPIHFPELVHEIFEDVRHMAPENIRLEFTQEGDTAFYSDPYRVNTLFKNIISNAVKYRRVGSPDSYLKIVATVNEQQARITFTDNGEGIGKEHINKIFDMFYRASNTSVGTGLGLYICREITNNLGGTIQVTSTPEVGSVFTVTLKNLK